eukprot:m51a1_g11295 hypothetical protein (957) ;mRNA; r:55135-58902
MLVGIRGIKGTRKALASYIKRNAAKDVTEWCHTNMPCPEDDRPHVVVTEVTGVPPRISTREVAAHGVMPFSWYKDDLSDCVMEYLDMRRLTIDPIQKTPIERDVNFSKATLMRTNMRGSALARVSFEKANLELAVLNSCLMQFCNLSGAHMRKTSLVAATLDHADVSEVNAPASNWSHASAESATFRDSWMCSKDYYDSPAGREAIQAAISLGMWAAAQFSNARLKRCDFRKAKLCAVDFSGCDLTCAMFVEADLRYCNFSGAKLCGANFSRANLRGAKNLEKADLTWAVFLGGASIDQDLSQHKDAAKLLLSQSDVERWAPEFSDVNLAGTDVSNFNLSGCNLAGCSLAGALMRNTNLSRANLSCADFTDADMFGADLSGADISSARFPGADMKYVNLSGVDLFGSKDALLEAKTLLGAACTIGAVPKELRDRGVSDNARENPRLNSEALTFADERIRNCHKRDLAAQHAQSQLDAMLERVDRLDSMIGGLAIARVGAAEMPSLRLRVLTLVARERHTHGFPSAAGGAAEVEDRWSLFRDGLLAFGEAAAGSRALRKIYAQLIAAELSDDAVTALWRRTRDVSALRMGSLECMCVEAMIRSRPWSEWAPLVSAWAARAAQEFPDSPGRERSAYLRALFRSKFEDQAGGAAQESPSATQSPKTFAPSVVGSPVSPVSPGHVVDERFLKGLSNSDGLRAIPGESVPRILWQTAPSAPSTPVVPPWASHTTNFTLNALSPSLTPPGMTGVNPGPLPVSATPTFCGLGYGFYGIPPPMRSPGTAGASLLPPFGVGPGVGMGVGVGAPPSVLPYHHHPVHMSPPMTQFDPASALMSGALVAAAPHAHQQQPRSPRESPPARASSQRMKCVECGMVLESTFIKFHKKDCRMRMVSCSQCKYQMRYVQWDTHNQYCNTVGVCPFCGKNVKDNLIVHMYERHQNELQEKGFFKGVEPPTRIGR